ncbi:MAG: hypothetical protein JW982_04870 [Spirochaetes bacterium]|nr:hypothetical protein [Spirochaetota bacterium]
MLKKYKFSAAFAVILFSSLIIFAESEKKYLLEIENLEQKNNSASVLAKIGEFKKKFPKSSQLERLDIIEADHTSPAKSAIVKFRNIEKKSPNYETKSYCRFKICSIYYLQSSWENLERESDAGIRLYPKSGYYYDFYFFKAKAYFHKQLFSESYRLCSLCIEQGPKFYFYPEARLLHNYLEQKVSGNSTVYTANLSISSVQFADTGVEISSLFLLGRQYEYRKQYNPAFSIYTDILKNYPKSPEADFCRERLAEIKQFNPVYTGSYLKNSDPDTDFLNISPEDDVNTVENRNFYVIELGPFHNLKNVENIKELINNSFKHVIVVRKKTFFSLYVEQTADPEDALKIRIRLAEEFGLNGNIVFVKNDDGVQYYYGDGQ